MNELGFYMNNLKNFWLLSQNQHEFKKYKSMKFLVCGWPQRFRKRVQRMEIGDNIILYNSIQRKFFATIIIQSNYYIKNEPYLDTESIIPNNYFYYIKTKPEIILSDLDAIPAESIAPRLEYLKKWSPERWPLAFFDSLHLLPQQDYRLLENIIINTNLSN